MDTTNYQLNWNNCCISLSIQKWSWHLIHLVFGIRPGWNKSEPLNISKIWWRYHVWRRKCIVDFIVRDLEYHVHLGNPVTWVTIISGNLQYTVWLWFTFITLHNDSIKVRWVDLSMWVLLFWPNMNAVHYFRWFEIATTSEFDFVIHRHMEKWDLCVVGVNPLSGS